MKKLIYTQFIVLLIGTVFAWTNFMRELFAWLNQEACTMGCSLSGIAPNPFLTACFYGAIFFTLAFALSLIMLYRSKKNPPAVNDGHESGNP